MWRLVPCVLLLLARGVAAQSVTYLDVPLGHFPTAVGTIAFASTDDLPQCVDWVEKVGIDDATKIHVEVASAAGASSSLTIYRTDGACPEDDGGGTCILATTGVKNWSTTGVKTDASGLTAFDLVRAVEYRVCICRDGTGGTLRAATNVTLSIIGGWHNALATHMGTAANSCSTGAPPTDTGTLSAVNSQIPYFRLYQ